MYNILVEVSYLIPMYTSIATLSQAARPSPSTELMAENLKLYLLAFFPAFLSAVVADMALGRRLGPSPPRAGADDRPTL